MTRPKPDPSFEWTSPSQYEKYVGCPRQWAARYIQKLPEPTTAKQQFGTEVHDEIEKYYKQGTPPRKHVRLVTSMLKLLPPPYLSPVAEGRIELDVLPATGDRKAMKLQGYRDLFLPPRSKKDAWPSVLVLDHKTTSSPQWAKTREVLEAGDIQAVCYTRDGEVQHPEIPPEDIEVQWTYGLSKGRKPPWAVRANIPLSVRAEVWGRLVEDSAVMRDMKAEQLPLADVPANYDSEACTKFGGCPHAAVCQSLRKAEDMDRKKTWAARLAEATKKTRDLTPDQVKELADEVKQEAGINPPEAALVEEKAEPDPEPALVKVEEPVKKKKGRPKKQKVEAPAPAPEPTPLEKVEKIIPKAVEGLHVYVNCFPVKGALEPILPLYDLCYGASQAVCDKEKVPHWNLLEFGRGPAALSAEFEKRAPRSGTVLVDHFTNEGKALLPYLERVATVVVKA